jgi:predicted DNA-binding transcriptional regulator YafY
LETLESRLLVYDSDKNYKSDFLSIIQSAIVNLQVLKIQYHTMYSDTIKDRFVEPLAVYFTKDNWLLIAHCRLRNEIREFRIDRILKLTNTYDTFQAKDFSFDHYIQQHSENT